MAIGGDLEQLFALERTLQRQSGTVEELTSSISTELANVYWEGPAAERFRAVWENEFAPTLKSLRDALTDAGNEVSRRRQALDDAGS